MSSPLCNSHGGEDPQAAADDDGAATNPDRSPPFKQFDIATDYSDHQFANSNPFASSIGADVSKKIMREWKILERNLPESIFVRAYEERIDLLRAVIIGPTGTPYHDGLFFFDLAFTADYPTTPPRVHYHAQGLRLNPNLYEDGYVCLSLLNTWEGKAEERWNPGMSTVLQVLVSIQALVLNERPYFNEPEVEEEEMYSEAYNKEAYLLGCKMMVRVVKSPVRNFEGFVRDYFGRRGEGILAACKAYSEGRVRIGRFCDRETSSCSKSNSVSVSAIFKALMEKTYWDLHAAFANNAALPHISAS